MRKGRLLSVSRYRSPQCIGYGFALNEIKVSTMRIGCAAMYCGMHKSFSHACALQQLRVYIVIDPLLDKVDWPSAIWL